MLPEPVHLSRRRRRPDTSRPTAEVLSSLMDIAGMDVVGMDVVGGSSARRRRSVSARRVGVTDDRGHRRVTRGHPRGAGRRPWCSPTRVRPRAARWPSPIPRCGAACEVNQVVPVASPRVVHDAVRPCGAVGSTFATTRLSRLRSATQRQRQSVPARNPRSHRRGHRRDVQLAYHATPRTPFFRPPGHPSGPPAPAVPKAGRRTALALLDCGLTAGPRGPSRRRPPGAGTGAGNPTEGGGRAERPPPPRHGRRPRGRDRHGRTAAAMIGRTSGLDRPRGRSTRGSH